MQTTTRQVGLTQLTTTGQSAKASDTGFEAVLVTVVGTTYTYNVEVYDEILTVWCVLATFTQAQTSFVHELYGAHNFRINCTDATTLTSIDATALELRSVS